MFFKKEMFLHTFPSGHTDKFLVSMNWTKNKFQFPVLFFFFFLHKRAAMYEQTTTANCILSCFSRYYTETPAKTTVISFSPIQISWISGKHKIAILTLHRCLWHFSDFTQVLQNLCSGSQDTFPRENSHNNSYILTTCWVKLFEKAILYLNFPLRASGF